MKSLHTNLRVELLQRLLETGIIEVNLYPDVLEVSHGDDVVFGKEGEFTQVQVSRSLGINPELIHVSDDMGTPPGRQVML